MKELKQEIAARQFKQLYLLYGEESYLKNEFKNRLKKALLPEGDMMNFTAYEGKGIDVQQVISQADTLPFFADRRLILIENSGFFKKACPELVEYLPRLPQETVLLFVEEEIDKRSKLYKLVDKNGRAVLMDRQKPPELRRWILGELRKEGRKITAEALERFMAMAGDHMENIAQELEKLLTYTLEKDVIQLRDVEAVCTVTLEDRIFEMLRAIVEKKQRHALDLYYELLAQKEEPMRILVLMGRQFNQIFLTKNLCSEGIDNGQIARKVGIHPYFVKQYVGWASRYSEETLHRILETCVKTEEDIKTGRIGDRLAVEMLIVQFSA